MPYWMPERLISGEKWEPMSAPDPFGPDIQQAYRLARDGDREGALAILYGIVAIAPDHRDAWWLITQVTPHTHQRVEALRRVLQIDPAFAPARQLAARYGYLDKPTLPSAGQAAAPPSAPPPAPDYRSHPVTPAGDVPAPPAAPAYPEQAYPPYSGTPAYEVSAPPPAPDYVSHPAESHPAPVPPLEPGEPIPPPGRTRRRPESDWEMEPEPEHRPTPRQPVQIQPFLVVNGGCVSGCFSLLLTILAGSVLAVLMIGESVSLALQNVGALPAGQSLPLNLVPAVVLTALLAFLRTGPVLLPIDFSAIVPGLDPANLPNPAQVFGGALNTLWASLGYPAQTGDVIIARLSTLGAQLDILGWLLPVLWLGGWVILAFLFVFMRARAGRLLHWFLSTVGLWLLAGAAVSMALLLFRLANGG
ncbi:MAG: hypothetical protein HPY64_08805 [Anaerolineae bacterium]|nr:hypothetical protein [Anaerolineae bacterium]